jgi:hypothetical protein
MYTLYCPMAVISSIDIHHAGVFVYALGLFNSDENNTRKPLSTNCTHITYYWN